MRYLQAIVFDFDGVLADTEPLHLAAFREALSGDLITIDRDEYYARYLGHDDATVVWMAAASRGLRLTDEQVEDRVAEKARRFAGLLDGGSALMPGASSCLRDWSPRVPIAIASGALRSEIEAVVGGAGLSAAVEVIVAAGETARGKPAPDPFLRAVELLGRRGRPPGAIGRAAGAGPIVPARAVAIEDSPAGVASARSAGLVTVALTTSREAGALAAADLVVSSLEALSLEALDALVGSVAPRGAPAR